MDYSLYWQHTDFLSKSLFFILVLMSVVSWCAIVLRVLDTRQLQHKALMALQQSVLALRHRMHGLTPEQRKSVAEQALLQQLGRVRLQTERGLSVLGTTAAVAPFVGLFGTVWGIFHALHAIGQSGQAGLGQVAGPVGEALIMTGLGLAVAIPAVLGYNLCVRLNRKMMASLQDEAHSVLMEQLLPATSVEKTAESTKPVSQLAGSQA
ncbi:MAG: MotA/TolQ/ExbB proton channel family protein [Pseudomonadota bacterium]|nr:MotA/TolQ/ExbB proton channel family protein [Pseudomonadota bacterium]